MGVKLKEYLYRVESPFRVETVAIYVLVDPNTEEIRYVGQTVKPKQRYLGHISAAKVRLKATPRPIDELEPNHNLYDWINVLLADDLIPLMYVVDEVPWEEADARERAWIKHFNEAGAALLNKRKSDWRRHRRRRWWSAT